MQECTSTRKAWTLRMYTCVYVSELINFPLKNQKDSDQSRKLSIQDRDRMFSSTVIRFIASQNVLFDLTHKWTLLIVYWILTFYRSASEKHEPTTCSNFFDLLTPDWDTSYKFDPRIFILFLVHMRTEVKFVP